MARKNSPYCKYEKQEAEKIFRNKNSNNEKLQVGQKKKKRRRKKKNREKETGKSVRLDWAPLHMAPPD